MGLIIPNNASGATKVYCVFQTRFKVNPHQISHKTLFYKEVKNVRGESTKGGQGSDHLSTADRLVFSGKSLSRDRAIFPRTIAFGKEPSERDKARNASATERRAQRLRKLGALLTTPWEPEREVDTNASACPRSLVGLGGFCPLSCQDSEALRILCTISGSSQSQGLESNSNNCQLKLMSKQQYSRKRPRFTSCSDRPHPQKHLVSTYL